MIGNIGIFQGKPYTKKAFFEENPYEQAFFSTKLTLKKHLKGNQWESLISFPLKKGRNPLKKALKKDRIPFKHALNKKDRDTLKRPLTKRIIRDP